MARAKTTSDWNRLPGETPRAYKAFLTYRDLGPDRSLLKTYRLRTGYETATVPGYFGQWSRDHDWVRRASAWDEAIQNGKDKLTRHLATEAQNHRYQRHFAILERFEPILAELIERITNRDLSVLDVCRLVRELRALEGALQGGFAPRANYW